MLQIRSDPVERGMCCPQILILLLPYVHFTLLHKRVGLFLLPCVHSIWYNFCLWRFIFLFFPPHPWCPLRLLACAYAFYSLFCVSELQHKLCLIALDAQRVEIPWARPVCMAAQRRHLPHQPPQCHQTHTPPAFLLSHTESSRGPSLHV